MNDTKTFQIIYEKWKSSDDKKNSNELKRNMFVLKCFLTSIRNGKESLFYEKSLLEVDRYTVPILNAKNRGIIRPHRPHRSINKNFTERY